MKRLQGFLGMLNFYKSSIPKAAAIHTPLNELLKSERKRNRQLDWNDVQINAFDNLKEAIANAALLVYHSTFAPFSLMADASDTK